MRQESEDRLRKLADYLILNGYSKNVSGLYFGKAGNALVLFEIARALDDEWINNHAFELLNQSLLSKTKVCDLLNGVAGIAYALNYAVEGGFVESDDDLFGEEINVLCGNFIQEHTNSIERIYKLSHRVYVFNKMKRSNDAELRVIALKLAFEELDFILQQTEMILSGKCVNNHILKQRYLLLCKLLDKWQTSETLPEDLLELRTMADRTIVQLSEKGYWIADRIKPTPLQIRDITEPSVWSGTEDIEAIMTQSGRSIKSSLFEGAGRVALLELFAVGKGNERISELLTLPDFTTIQGDQNTLNEEEKI